MQDSSSEQDKQAYKMLVTRLQYFLFDLFYLGYVEDPQSGHSFSMPKGLEWRVYVEVCSIHTLDGTNTLYVSLIIIPVAGVIATKLGHTLK